MFHSSLLLLHLPATTHVRHAQAEAVHVLQLEGCQQRLPPERPQPCRRPVSLQLGQPRRQLWDVHPCRTFFEEGGVEGRQAGGEEEFRRRRPGAKAIKLF